MKKILIGISIVLISACSVKMMSFTKEQMKRGEKLFPGITAAELEQGKSLAETNCVKCHELKLPGMYDEATWRKIVPNMSAKVNAMDKSKPIGQKEELLLLKYHVTLSASSTK